MILTFDTEAFRKAIKQKRIVNDELSMDGLAQLVGISSATVYRLEKGYQPDMETFIKILNWLEENPENFIK